MMIECPICGSTPEVVPLEGDDDWCRIACSAEPCSKKHLLFVFHKDDTRLALDAWATRKVSAALATITEALK